MIVFPHLFWTIRRELKLLVRHSYPSYISLVSLAYSNREIERQLVKVDNIVIVGGLQSLTITPQGPPTNLQLIREVKLDDYCITVAASGDDVYVGCNSGKILKIDKQGQCEVFAQMTSESPVIVGLVIHKQLLYVLPWAG